MKLLNMRFHYEVYNSNVQANIYEKIVFLYSILK